MTLKHKKLRSVVVALKAAGFVKVVSETLGSLKLEPETFGFVKMTLETFGSSEAVSSTLGSVMETLETLAALETGLRDTLESLSVVLGILRPATAVPGRL